MAEIPVGRVEKEYGFRRHATTLSGDITRTVRYRGPDIVRAYFDMVEEACKILGVPKENLVIGESDLKIIDLSPSPKIFPIRSGITKIYDLAGKSYEGAKSLAQQYLSVHEAPLLGIVPLPHQEPIKFEYGRKYSDGKAWSRGHDFEAFQPVDSPLKTLDEMFKLPARGATNWDRTDIENIMKNSDLSGGGLKYTYLDTDVGSIRLKVPLSERLGLTKDVEVEWTQILFY